MPGMVLILNNCRQLVFANRAFNHLCGRPETESLVGPLCFNGEEFVVLAGTDVSHELRRLALERIFFYDILNLAVSIQGSAELMEIDESADPMMVSAVFSWHRKRLSRKLMPSACFWQ